IPALPLAVLSLTAPGQEPRLSHNSAAPGQHNPALFVHPPWCRAARSRPPPAPRRSPPSRHSRPCGCLLPAAPVRSSRFRSWRGWRRIEVDFTTIIDDAILRSPDFITAALVCLRQIGRAYRRLAVAAGDVEDIVGLAKAGDAAAQAAHQRLAVLDRGAQM